MLTDYSLRVMALLTYLIFIKGSAISPRLHSLTTVPRHWLRVVELHTQVGRRPTPQLILYWYNGAPELTAPGTCQILCRLIAASLTKVEYPL